MSLAGRKKFETGNPAEEKGFLSDVMVDRVPEKETLETRVRWDDYQKTMRSETDMYSDSYAFEQKRYVTAVNKHTAPNAKRAKWNVNAKTKIALVAYVVILIAIIILVVTSANKGLTSVFASTDRDEINEEAVFSVLSMDEEYYQSVAKTDYDSIEVTAEYVIVPEKQEKVDNNWFDKICDFIESAVGD